MGADQVEDLVLDVRPDRRPGWRCPVAVQVEGGRRGRGRQVAHVLHRHDHREIPGLGRRRGHHRHRVGPSEIAGHPLRGAHGRGQPDPLEGSGTLPVRRGARLRLGLFGDEGVEPLQRQGQMSAALGAGQRVHLVDDHGLHVPEDVPGRRGEHQEQRFRSGDQDVRRPADDLASVPGRGVARAHADADGRRRLTQTHSGLGDAGEGGPQVALDIDGQRLERGDVEHPTALLGRRMRIPDQRVERGQERRQGLAGPGRRDDQRVLPRRDGLPRPGLSGRGLGEHLGEPGGGRRAERGQRVRRRRGLNRHPHILPGPTDSGGLCASWDFGPAPLVSTSECT